MTATTRVLARALALKSLNLRLRSGLLTALTILGIYGVFLLLGSGTLSDRIGESVLLFMTTIVYATVSGSLVREVQWGTVEQLFMSPFGFSRIVLLSTVIYVLVAVVSGALLGGLLLLAVGGVEIGGLARVVLLGTVALGPAVGLGFLFGGLALLGKRVKTVWLVVPLVFVAGVLIPVGDSLLVKLVPLSFARSMLQKAMEGVVPLSDLVLLGLLSVVYISGGYLFLRFACRTARIHGRMNQY